MSWSEVEWVGSRIGLHESSSQEDDGVDDTDNPLVGTLSIDTKLLGERQIGTVGTSLIPALGSSTNGADTNGVPEHEGAVPLVITLVDQGSALILEQLRDVLKVLLVTGDQSSAAKEVSMLRHTVVLGVGTGFGNDSLDRFFL